MNYIQRKHVGLKILVAIAFLGFSVSSFAQQDKERLVQFTGVVVTGDSLKAVPYASIYIQGSGRGTVSDYYGYFSFVAQPADTIVFSCIGFKKSRYVIPDTLQASKYSVVQMMQSDTVLLRETVIYPWPTRDEFREAFLTLDIPDDDLERARRNLDLAQMRMRSEFLEMDGAENYRHAMAQKQQELYYAGQFPSYTIMNPVAWMKFFEAWKRGDFKRRDR